MRGRQVHFDSQPLTGGQIPPRISKGVNDSTFILSPERGPSSFVAGAAHVVNLYQYCPQRDPAAYQQAMDKGTD